MTDYAMKKTLDAGYDQAVEKVKAELKEEGFGVLTHIDVKATLKEKLDADFRRYEILGACNPSLAKKALEAELPIGVMLPCNVVVWETDGGKATVAAFNPMEAFPADASTTLKELADEVSARLKRVLDRL
jgi:uncharacterized protein (DUF302 family)